MSLGAFSWAARLPSPSSGGLDRGEEPRQATGLQWEGCGTGG